jgi:hypothetical protein
MKINKIIMTVLLLVAATVVTFAQAEKEAQDFGPKAGDVGLGIDIVPIFDYVGKLLNNSVNGSLNQFAGETWDVNTGDAFMNPTASILVKYMVTDNIAARANIGIQHRFTRTLEYRQDDAAVFLDPLSEKEVIDTRISNRSGAAISLGAEYRRGYKRIQGYLGADLLYGFTKNADRYSYGNKITDINQTPSRPGAGFIVTPPVVNGDWTQTYVLEHYNQGHNQFLGVDLRLGVEFFLASNLSLGGEVAYYMYGKMGAQEWMKTEGWNATTGQLEERIETISPGNNAFELGTNNIGGKLYMMFYF